MDDLVKATESHVRSIFEGEGSGHDWWHIDRVRKLALTIAKTEKADPVIVELGALLHDIADHKFHGGDHDIGHKTARAWLEKVEADAHIIEQVCYIVQNISYSGGRAMESVEGKIVQDADRLDALGAIGIARCFAYGGHSGRELYNPESKTTEKSPSINHFYEKLLLLKDRMNTKTGKKMAEARHAFIELYLDEFYKEWEGEK